MLKRQIGQIATSCGVFGLLLLPANAQEDRSQSPPPILKGGIVHQLRSLSADALESLKFDKKKTPTEAKNAPPAAPQSNGRTTLRRGNASPWLDSQTEEKATLRPNVRAYGSLPPAAYVPKTSGGIPHPIAAVPERLPDVVKPDQAIKSLRATSTQASKQGVASPGTGNRTSASNQRRSLLGSDTFGEVHIEEELPKDVKHSLRDSQVRAQAETRSKTDLRNKAPQVSRIPLPGSARSSREDTRSLTDNDEPLTLPPSTELTASDAGSSLPLQSIDDSPSTASLPSLDALPSVDSTSLDSPNTDLPSTDYPSVDLLVEPEITDATKNASLVASPQVDLPPLSAISSEALPTLSNNVSDSASIGREKGDLPTAVSVPTTMVSRPTTEGSHNAVPSLPAQNGLPTLAELPVAQNSTAVRNDATDASQQRTHVRIPVAEMPARLAAEASLEERLRLETPRIEVVLNGPADLPVGESAEYDVVVTNRDNIDLSGLILRLDVPAGVTTRAKRPSRGEIEVEQSADGMTLLTWIFEDLRAGASANAPIGMVAESPRNFAVAMEWTLTPVSGAAEVEVLSPQLEMALEGPSEVIFGEANTYRLHVRNPGNAAATNVAVRLSAEPFGASSAEVGSIPAGGEETIDVELTFSQKGVIGIAATATGAADLMCATKIDVLVKQPNLVASMMAPEMIYHGNQSDYRITINNTGDAEARDITAQCVIPNGAKPIRLPAGARLDSNRITWPIAVLKPGSSEDFDVQLSLSQEGENRVFVECSTVSGLAAKCAAATRVKAIVDLKLLVNDPIAPAPVGSEVVYELQLTNRGSKAANNVVVIAQFSEGIEPTRGEGHAFRVIPGQLLFEPVGRIAAGQSVVLKVFAKAASNGTHRFRAEVRSDDSELKLVQEESTHYLETSGRIASPPGTSVYR